jgi:RNA polymerase sigma-70 factor (ECF subfamily)
MAAFEELVARHRDKIYARAYSMMRNEEEAVDLSQEAWVKAWQRLKQFQGESSFATWMTRITINLCLDQSARNGTLNPSKRWTKNPAASNATCPPWPATPPRALNGELRARSSRYGAAVHEHRTVLIHEFEEMTKKLPRPWVVRSDGHVPLVLCSSPPRQPAGRPEERGAVMNNAVLNLNCRACSTAN